MIDADRLRALSIFEKVRRAPAGERDRLILEETADSAEVRAEVQRLLDHDSPTRFFLGKPCGRATLDLLLSLDGPPPVTIAQYHIVRELGRGGFGVVYLATQAFPRRDVAIKVMRNLVREEDAARFEFEAHALARLDHPCIARVIEAGRWPEGNGLPYIVMEYVEGEPLLGFAGAHAPSLDLRRNIIINLCAAVSHAHQRGVIHRDLSPRNILITRDGLPKVLDFGLARRVDPHADELSLGLTQDGVLMGTVRYMSPEQLRAQHDKVDIRSDVYSLGVIAFELLTGRHPYLGQDPSLVQAIEALRSHNAVRPRAAAPSLPADYDAVLLKAVERDPGRRYQTAVELAEDLRRVASGLPVAARKPSLAYRAARFAGRHRAPVAVSLILLGAAAFAGGRTLAAIVREAHAREGAMVALEAIVSRLISPLSTKIGTLEERSALLDTIRPEIERIVASAPDDPRSLRVLGSFLVALGDVERDSGDTRASLMAFERAAATYQRLWELNPADPAAGHAYSLAVVKLGDAHIHAGDRGTGLMHYASALTLDEHLVQQNPENLPLLSNLFWSYSRQESLHTLINSDRAAEYLEQSASVARRMVELSPDEWRSLEAFARIRQRQAYRASRHPDFPLAVELAREAVAAASQLAEHDPDSSHFLRLLVDVLLDLASATLITGNHLEATNHLRSARDAAHTLCSGGCEQTTDDLLLARIECTDAAIAMAAGDLQRTIELALGHEDIAQRLLLAGVTSIDLHTQRANAHVNLIRAFVQSSRPDRAEGTMRRLIDIEKRVREEFSGSEDARALECALVDACLALSAANPRQSEP